ncbi:MAG TPA: hypothetical protein VI932_12000 [Bacteroidota bacterium]|nr:hypothetical protein [Bacteroidota bacterium]
MIPRATGVLGKYLAAAVAAALIFGSLSCGDGSTEPDPHVGPGAPFLSFTVDDSTLIGFSGPGAWPPSGTGVIARMDTAGSILQIAGYRQTAGKPAGPAGPEPRFNFLYLEISDTGLISTRTYLPGEAMLGRDIPLSDLDSLGYAGVTGSVTLTSVTMERIAGTFFGSGMRQSDSAMISIAGGSFDVPYGRGLFSFEDTGSSGGDIRISVGTGVVPAYEWEGGPVYAVGVTRVGAPTTLVWGIVTAGGDSIPSGLAHGQVPAGAVRVANSEPVLTPGVAYRVTVSRVAGSYGYREFIP